MAGHFDIKRAGRLDSEERMKELRPLQLLLEVGGVTAGMTAVDLGCGTGTFALPLARCVGSQGIVYGVDDSAAMLDILRAKDPPPNLKLVQGDARNTGLPGQSADFCLLSFILHEVDDREGLVKEAFRLLKPSGKVLVVEWKAELESPGPPQELRLSREDVGELLKQAGFGTWQVVEWSGNHFAVRAAKTGQLWP